LIEPKGSVSRSSAGPVTDVQARKTAFVVAVVLLVITAWNLYRGRTIVVAVLGGAALLLVLIGLMAPTAARRFHIVWMKIAGFLGYVNSRILLSLIYYGAFAPYGLISRLVGRDPLKRRSTTNESYWTKRKTTRQSTESFERLF
jgi:hypothetical protein